MVCALAWALGPSAQRRRSVSKILFAFRKHSCLWNNKMHQNFAMLGCSADATRCCLLLLLLCGAASWRHGAIPLQLRTISTATVIR